MPRRLLRVALLGAAATVLLVSSAWAGLELEGFHGHMSFGYGQLYTSDAPGGSMSFAGGVDYRIQPRLHAGLEVGSWLLGSRTVERGTLSAELDYSVLELDALARWEPEGAPLMIAAGPSVSHARTAITSSAAPNFEDLAVDEITPGAALALTWIQRRPSPVRAGLELGVRSLWLTDATWTLFSARLAIHY
jgi:hypothetical protein